MLEGVGGDVVVEEGDCFVWGVEVFEVCDEWDWSFGFGEMGFFVVEVAGVCFGEVRHWMMGLSIQV